jgi:hypothetical protein
MNEISEYWVLVEWYWQGKTEVLEKHPSQNHSVHQKSHTDNPRTEPKSETDN